MIISILNQKGGVGKTTISVNLARGLQQEDHKVLVIDSDPQASAKDWHAAGDAELIPVIGIDRPTLDKDIRIFSHSYDYIIIDGAPQLENMAIAAIKCSDIILIPVQPSPYDVWATSDLVDVIKARQSIANGIPKAAFIINRQIMHTKLGKEIRGILGGYNFPVFNNGTFQRIIYAKTAATGSTVLDAEPNGEAASEIRKLIIELKEFINEPITDGPT